MPFKLLPTPPLRRRNHLGNRLRQNMNWTEANGVVFHAEHIWHFLLARYFRDLEDGLSLAGISI